MKRSSIIMSIVASAILIFTLVIACDPIYRLAVRLTFSSLRLSGFPWESGMSSLPLGSVSAKAEDCWRKAFPQNGDRVLETRRILVLSPVQGFEICTGILVEHNNERWIYLFYPRNKQWIMKMFPG